MFVSSRFDRAALGWMVRRIGHTCVPECVIEHDREMHYAEILGRGPATVIGPAHITSPSWVHGRPIVLTWTERVAFAWCLLVGQREARWEWRHT